MNRIKPSNSKRKRSFTAGPSSAGTISSARSAPILSLQRSCIPGRQNQQVLNNSDPSVQDYGSQIDDDYNEELEHVVVAIDMKERGAAGCAYYVAREERLFCMEDVAINGKDVLEMRKQYPTSSDQFADKSV